jgi:hypothetical protein
MVFLAEQMGKSVDLIIRGTQFMKSMPEDPKTDRAGSNSFYAGSNIVISQMDSLTQLLKNPSR